MTKITEYITIELIIILILVLSIIIYILQESKNIIKKNNNIISSIKSKNIIDIIENISVKTPNKIAIEIDYNNHKDKINFLKL